MITPGEANKEWAITNPDIYLANGAAGRVRVFTNVNIRGRDKILGAAVLEFRLHRQGTPKAQKKCGCRWIQFAYAETSNSNQKFYRTRQGYYPFGTEGRHPDGNLYYDTGGAGNWSDVESTLIDRPMPVWEYIKANQWIKNIFDTILVCGEKPFYLVHWEYHVTRDSTDFGMDEKKTGFFNVDGHPIDRLPGWASEKTFLHGYRSEELKSQYERYGNPIPRQFWDPTAASAPSSRPGGK